MKVTQNYLGFESLFACQSIHDASTC